MSDFILAGDIGATSCTIALVNARGEFIEREHGPGANIRSTMILQGFEHVVTSTLAKLLKRYGTRTRLTQSEILSRINRAHFAVAGANGPVYPRVQAALEKALRHFRAQFPLTLINEILPAFSANAAQASTGILAMAGTGATTCAIVNGRVIRQHDGLGWVLGDRGSGTWMGLEILRACAADLDGLGPRTALTNLVLQSLSIATDVTSAPRPATNTLAQLIDAVSTMKPAAWTRFAPLHDRAIREGDAVAQQLLDATTAQFVRAIESCRQALLTEEIRGETLLVWAGGVAMNSPALRAAVNASVAEDRGELALIPTLTQDPIIGVARHALTQR
ncbi:MAG: BadF/BadG/BcrA/BcrD ATPase family protein [Actinomycetaceae bacterium]|nr:BadF/BadG/BcrA/BcrD ATPase family protein [Actinomycetaceae bacterium]